MFEHALLAERPSAVIVDIQRRDCMRSNPEIAIVFGNGGTMVGMMCEVRSGTYDKLAQAISRNPAVLEQLFSAFDDGLRGDVSIPHRTAILKQSSTITFNNDKQELELNRYPQAE
jgi:hypothetical protein